jgi:hypothetical protein
MMEYDALIHYHFDTQQSKNNLPILPRIFITRLKNDFTNNYPIFTQMHTFSVLGRMPWLQKGTNVGTW